jgi:diguanylate cyclase (GGDEF)-like protein
MTRFTAELLDRAFERRFRRYNLPQQRRTALAALVLILVTNMGSFGYSVLVTGMRASAALWLTQVITNAVGAALAIGLARARVPRRIFYAVVAAVLFMTVAVAVLIATGQAMAFRGALLVVGGVIVIYVSAPLTLVGVTGLGLLYSAVTIPIWLLATDLGPAVDVPYVLVATALAHALSFNEARRAQRERRVLFAQRELLHRQSNADALTGLINRRAFDCRLQQTWEAWQTTRGPLSVLMIDIDHFKVLNDTDGHAAGDRALRRVAGLVQLALPSPECDAARYGGEEFACLLPGVGAVEASAAAEDMVGRIRAAGIPMRGPGDRRALTISVGVATAHADMESATDLLDAADRQLYSAKQSGRDRVGATAPVADLAPVQALPQPASAGMTWLSSRSSDLAS